jgi:hypothetical protein
LTVLILAVRVAPLREMMFGGDLIITKEGRVDGVMKVNELKWVGPKESGGGRLYWNGGPGLVMHSEDSRCLLSIFLNDAGLGLLLSSPDSSCIVTPDGIKFFAGPEPRGLKNLLYEVAPKKGTGDDGH